MGTITVEGLGEVRIAGDEPTKEELQRIALTRHQMRQQAKTEEMKATDAEIGGWSQPPGPMRVQQVPPPPPPGAPVAPRVAASEMAGEMPVPGAEVAPPPAAVPREFPDAPSTLAINPNTTQGFEQTGTPIEAAKDLARSIYNPQTGKWFTSTPASRDLAKLPAVFNSTVGVLSTDDPKKRQDIIVKNVPGAERDEDKYGNPMIKMPDGQQYYTSGKDLDRLRLGLGLAGGLAIGATLPVTGPTTLAIGGLVGSVGQSVAEDLVAKAAGAEGDTVDLAKAGWAAAFGLLPGALALGKKPLGMIVERLLRNQPMTDDMLREVGLTAAQIESLTPKMREEITRVARTTFDDQTAVGASYRKQLADELGLTGEAGPTKGLLSGDPVQIAVEKELAEQGGTKAAADVINTRRAAQDVKLSEAQERLRAQAGGHPGTPPLTEEEASAILQRGYDESKGWQTQGRDISYGVARDPAAVVDAGGTYSLPAPIAARLGPSTRSTLDTNDIGRIVLGETAQTSTPFSKEALEVVENWSKRRTGPRRFAMDEPGGTGIGLPDVTWQEAENLRQKLVILQNKAQGAVGPGGGISQDVAALQQILDNFDKQFGSLNPLYAPARKAHEELKSIFTAGGSVDQDAATKAVLKVMEGPEGGQAIVNTMFGPSFSKNQSQQMLDHLMTKVFPNHPEQQAVIREMALRRLLVDPKTGEALSPQKMVTALDRGLGDRELKLYQGLLSGEDFRMLRQLHEMQKIVASSRNPINPPRSGLLINSLLKQGGAGVGGAYLGSEADLGPAGTIGGGIAGMIAGRYIPMRQARGAINPPAGYAQGGRPGPLPAQIGVPAAGLLADEANRPGPGPIINQPGPADRIMQGLLGCPSSARPRPGARPRAAPPPRTAPGRHRRIAAWPRRRARAARRPRRRTTPRCRARMQGTAGSRARASRLANLVHGFVRSRRSRRVSTRATRSSMFCKSLRMACRVPPIATECWFSACTSLRTMSTLMSIARSWRRISWSGWSVSVMWFRSRMLNLWLRFA